MKALRLLSFATFFLVQVTMAQNSQTCTLSCPANVILQATPGQEGAYYNYPAWTSPAECGTLTYFPASGSFFRLGSHSVTITSATGQKCSFTITVTDNEAPSLSPITLSRSVIWPASNKMKKVIVSYTTSDNGASVKTNMTITSNAPEGDARDWEIVDDHLIRLKSSRLPDGSPRIYTITVTATDDSGNKTTRTTTLAVSKTMVAKAATR